MPDRSSLTDRAGDHISGPPSLTGRCGSWAARAAISPNRTGRRRGLGPPRTLLATVVLIAMSTVWEAWAEHEHGTSMHHRANFSGCPSIESLGPTFPKPWTITYGHVCKVGDRLVFGDENGQHFGPTTRRTPIHDTAAKSAASRCAMVALYRPAGARPVRSCHGSLLRTPRMSSMSPSWPTKDRSNVPSTRQIRPKTERHARFLGCVDSAVKDRQ